jgi:hypothetical protein
VDAKGNLFVQRKIVMYEIMVCLQGSLQVANFASFYSLSCQDYDLEVVDFV